MARQSRPAGTAMRAGSYRSIQTLTPRQKRGFGLLAVIQWWLTAAALTDIIRRDRGEINGRKGLWAIASFINFAGPICYFLFGRRPAVEAKSR